MGGISAEESDEAGACVPSNLVNIRWVDKQGCEEMEGGAERELMGFVVEVAFLERYCGWLSMI